MMIHQRLRKAGNSYVVTIPKEEVERHSWKTGRQFVVQLTPLEERPVLRSEVRDALESRWEKHADGYQYLADRKQCRSI